MTAALDRLRDAAPDALGAAYEALVLECCGIDTPRVDRWTEAYEQVSRGLTTDRATALARPSGTWGDDDHRLAAALVFGQRTLLTLLPLLRAHPLPGAAVTDMGSGSGAAALAATMYGAREVTLVERSAGATALARSLLERCGASVQVSSDGLEAARVRTPAVLAAHSLNEVFEARGTSDMAAVVGRWVDEVGPTGRVYVLEPGTHASSTRLQAVRDRVVGSGRAVVGPCTHALPCPMVGRPRDWCHFTSRAAMGPLARAIMRGAGRNPDELPYAWLVCGASPMAERLEGASRVLSVRGVGKGKTAAFTCDDRGIRSLTALDRRAGAEQVTSLEAGDVVAVRDAGLSLRGDGHRVESPGTVELIHRL